MDVSFEKATIEDAPKLIEVQNKSLYDDYVAYGECPGFNYSMERMESTINNAIVYKIVVDGKIVGDIIVRKLKDNNYYLGGICVVPKYQNMGIGQKAIKHIESNNSDAISWELITPLDSHRNRHFYEKMGYKKVNEYKHSDKLTLFTFRKVVKVSLT